MIAKLVSSSLQRVQCSCLFAAPRLCHFDFSVNRMQGELVPYLAKSGGLVVFNQWKGAVSAPLKSYHPPQLETDADK